MSRPNVASVLPDDAHPASGGAETTLQPGEVGPILDAKGLWGGNPFDVNGKIADVVFKAIDKAGFTGKVSASLRIDDKGNVKIEATQPAVQSALQAAFGAKMGAAIKGSKREVPAGGLTVPWLEGVGNA